MQNNLSKTKHCNHAQLEIKSDFNNFKVGLINRICNNYENTPERHQAIQNLEHVKMIQAVQNNVLCKEILPILWNATPPQNEKDYCDNSHMIYVHMMSDCNKELKVRSYFYGNIKGNPIKGGFLQSEVEQITSDNIINIIKQASSREILEESNIKLSFNDDKTCTLNIYNNIIIGKYEIKESKTDSKHHVTIRLSCDDYELLKQTFIDNLEEHKIFMENTGEISGLIL